MVDPDLRLQPVGCANANGSNASGRIVFANIHPIGKGVLAVDAQSYRQYDCGMGVAKVAVSMDNRLLRRLDSLVKREVFRSRSEGIQKAVAEKLERLERSRLARECAKLAPAEEQEMAEEGIVEDMAEWPEY